MLSLTLTLKDDTIWYYCLIIDQNPHLHPFYESGIRCWHTKANIVPKTAERGGHRLILFVIIIQAKHFTTWHVKILINFKLTCKHFNKLYIKCRSCLLLDGISSFVNILFFYKKKYQSCMWPSFWLKLEQKVVIKGRTLCLDFAV